MCNITHARLTLLRVLFYFKFQNNDVLLKSPKKLANLKHRLDFMNRKMFYEIIQIFVWSSYHGILILRPQFTLKCFHPEPDRTRESSSVVDSVALDLEVVREVQGML
jgi:hypothetical protein